MCDGKNEDGESGGTQDGQGTPPTLTPTTRLQRTSIDTQNSYMSLEEPHVGPDMEGYSEPSLSEFDSVEGLNNGYKLVSNGEIWLLFDDEGEFIREFGNREDAVKEAYRLKPLPRLGM